MFNPVVSEFRERPGFFTAAARSIGERTFARAAALDDDDSFPLEDVRELSASGLLTAPLPPEYGGAGLGSTAEGAAPLAQVLCDIGGGSLPLGRLYEGHVNALVLVSEYGQASQIRDLAKEAASGRLCGVWNTQDAHGLRLVQDGSGFRLDGCKIFASGAGFIERPLVTATTDAGALVMVTPRLTTGRRADLSQWRAHGMRASATGSVDLTGLAVRSEDVIGADGDYLRQPFFSGGAWRFAAVQVGGVRRLFDEMRRHLCAAGRDRDPHQLARVGDAAIDVETAWLWVERAAFMAESRIGEADRAVAYVDLARLAVEKAALSVLQIAHRSIGLAAFLRTHPIERLSRDLATYLRQPTPDRALTSAAAYVLANDAPSRDLWR